MEQELDRVRLDMKGMLASLEDKALGAPPKKRRTVLFSDSDDDLDQETDEVTAPDEIDAYPTTNFDFEDGNDAPLPFWKSHRTRFPKLTVIASKCLFDSGVAEQERTSVQCSWTRDD